MQERQFTLMSNTYYNLVSVLYHALESAQTVSSYIRDAEQANNQQLAQFLRQVHQDANKQAEQARQLLKQMG
jgi:hypothetical protein